MEYRVYGIDINKIYDGVELYNFQTYSDEQWMELSEEQGNVWSLDGFQNHFNQGNITEIFIRIIKIEK